MLVYTNNFSKKFLKPLDNTGIMCYNIITEGEKRTPKIKIERSCHYDKNN